MFIAVFRRWLNRIGTAYTHAKGGQNISLFRRKDASYSIREEQKMTLRYTRYLSLLAWVAALVSPLLIAPAVAQTDYDSEDNRYIDITTLAQLNAIRWDLDGNGAVADSDTANYNAAFPNAATGMGCPSTGCNGYELKADLDFDTDGSRGATPVTSADDYPNWNPIGGTYSAPFKGNNNTISNLTMDRTGDAGLFYALSDTVEGLGLSKVNVVSTANMSALAANLNSGGAVIGCWSTGTVRGRSAGGLIGFIRDTSRVAASFSATNVTAHATVGVAGGLVINMENGIMVASYATGTVTGNKAGGLIGASGTRVARIIGTSRGARCFTATAIAGCVPATI